jgi:hypothetical protein
VLVFSAGVQAVVIVVNVVDCRMTERASYSNAAFLIAPFPEQLPLDSAQEGPIVLNSIPIF